MGRTLELGCGWEIRPLNCTSLGLAEGMGDVTLSGLLQAWPQTDGQ